jgi:hypothetical protein
MREVRFHIGDRVRFRLGIRSVLGVVREDRGAIGIKGRRLYRVEFREKLQPPGQIELPAEEMRPVRTRVAAK